MQIQSISNAKWNNAQETSLDCDVIFVGNPTVCPYTAANNTGDPIVQAVWNAAIAGTVAAYTPPVLTPQQQAIAAIAAGIVVTCTSSPGVNGTYSCTQTAQNNVNAVATYIALNSNFPGGSSTMPWADQAGNIHVFPSVAVFKEFATAFCTFVAAVLVFGDSNGQAGGIPSNAITIP